jgi:hypothetical protein
LHDRLPAACVWLAVDPQGNHWVYDELWLPEADIETLANAIHAQEGDLEPKIRLIDPAMDKDNTLAFNFNPRKELMKYGVYCQRANNDPYLGKSRIRQALRPQYSHILKASLPQLRISRFCPRVIYEFQHYIWDEYVRVSDRDRKDKPKKINDHFMDSLRYIYNQEPRYMPPELENEGEIEYSGTYTKYPTKSVPRGSYHSLVEKD